MRLKFEEVLTRVEKLLDADPKPKTVKAVAAAVPTSWDAAKDALCELRRRGKASEFPVGWVRKDSSGERSLLDRRRMEEELLSMKQWIAEVMLQEYRAKIRSAGGVGDSFSAEMRNACEVYEAITRRMVP